LTWEVLRSATARLVHWQAPHGARVRHGTSPDRGRPRAHWMEASMAGESLRIKGEITANEDLRFEGEIEGTISVPEHTLVVGRTARVHANVQAKAIVVAGSLMGSAVAKERCEVQEAATVEGTVETPRLSIKEGACLTAQVLMPMPSDKKKDEGVVHHDFQASVA
jgi:cytoskeletal protein CcmA (bactofilin family)